MKTALATHDFEHLTRVEREELDTRSQQLGRDTPKGELSRNGAFSSPFVATPPAPSRTCRASLQSGGRQCANNTNINDSLPALPTSPEHDEFPPAREDSGVLSKDFLVLELEEENDRLHNALSAERRARQLAEAEANLHAARVREYEDQVRDLTSQLSDAQQKLAELEQAAFSRAMVQAWLETTIPQRRCSADQGPEGSVEAASVAAVEAEAEALLCSKPSEGPAFISMENTYFGPTLTDPDGTSWRAASPADGEALVEASCANPLYGVGSDEVCAQVYPACGECQTDVVLLDLGGSSQRLDQRKKDGRVSPPSLRCGGGAQAVTVTALTPTYGYCDIAHCTDTGAASAGSGRAGDHGISKARTFATRSPLQRACAMGSVEGCVGGLAPTWSLPLQGEKCRRPQPLPRHQGCGSPRGAARALSPPVPPAPAPQDQLLLPWAPPPQLISMEASAVPATATWLEAEHGWMPAGADLCRSWGFESSQCGAQTPSSPSPSPSRPLQKALASLGDVSGLRHHHHHQPHHQSQQPLWLGPVRTAGCARKLRGAEGATSLPGDACAVAAGCQGTDPAAAGRAEAVRAFQPVGLASAGPQYGGEWCTIPLGSPDCTPRKGAQAPAVGPA